jgi:hypothetical protein
VDLAKCAALKRGLAKQPEPQIVSISTFFDGNDDMGSIGCNLLEHPGLGVFHATLAGLLTRPDVRAVYAQITELDPGEGSWPFTDTVLVVGSISTRDLETVLKPLQPDEVGPASPDSLSPSLSGAERSSTLVAWWD